MKPITILLAEDNQLFTDIWTHVFNTDGRFKVVGSCSDPLEVHKYALALNPSILLIDMHAEHGNYFGVIRRVLASGYKGNMIVLAINAMPLVAKRLFSLGIKGYITKNCSIDEMMEAIEEVHAGNIYLEKNILELLQKKEMLSTGDERWQLLSSREVEVVYAVREGLTSKEIALLLDITMKTVEVHRNNIMRKLGVRNTAALVNLTYAKGI